MQVNYADLSDNELASMQGLEVDGYGHTPFIHLSHAHALNLREIALFPGIKPPPWDINVISTSPNTLKIDQIAPGVKPLRQYHTMTGINLLVSLITLLTKVLINVANIDLSHNIIHEIRSPFVPTSLVRRGRG